MAEKSFFFNAFPDETFETGYDRNYNADDISDFFKIVFETGVVKGGLEVSNASEDLIVNISSGRASILGKPYYNDSIKSFTLKTAPTGAKSRYDYIVLRYDNTPTKSGRKIYLDLVDGTENIPQVSDLTRTDTIYELLLAYIEVKPFAISLLQSDITDCRDKKDNLNKSYCGYFTAVKGYQDYYDAIVMPYTSKRVIDLTTYSVLTDIPSSLYNDKYSIIEVHKNGLLVDSKDYTFATNNDYITITFTEEVKAGAIVSVVLSNFIDGEGLSTAINDYTNWTSQVESLVSKGDFVYECNGVNDNVLLSNVVKAFLSGGTDYGTKKIIVKGNIGMNAPVRGDGTTSNPYSWFDFNIGSNRRVIVDFSNCGQISPTISDGTYNHIFHSNNNIDIIGANVVASNTTPNTIIRIMGTTSGIVHFEKCRFYITAYQDSLIALRGTFTNCRGSVANIINNSYCFLTASNGVVRLIGGEYYAYTSDSSKQSAIVGQSGTDAVSILYGVSAPTLARSGYYQTNSLLQYAGGGMVNCTDLISELPLIVVSGISNIRGTIAKSKPNLM